MSFRSRRKLVEVGSRARSPPRIAGHQTLQSFVQLAVFLYKNNQQPKKYLPNNLVHIRSLGSGTCHFCALWFKWTPVYKEFIDRGGSLWLSQDPMVQFNEPWQSWNKKYIYINISTVGQSERRVKCWLCILVTYPTDRPYPANPALTKTIGAAAPWNTSFNCHQRTFKTSPTLNTHSAKLLKNWYNVKTPDFSTACTFIKDYAVN